MLCRIGYEWLRPGGTALIDVFNPFVWAGWDGNEEHRMPNAAAGYDHELRERVRFDPVTCTVVDTWWEPADPDHPISQTLRCYTPADLMLLLDGTGLFLTGIAVGDDVVSVSPHSGMSSLVREQYEYLGVVAAIADS